MSRAADVDVVVAGGGVAGLVAARQLARLGQKVLVVEAQDALGGFVARHEVGGVLLDSGAESFATRKGTVAGLAIELGLGDDIVTPAPAGAWVAWDGGTAPLPASGLLGIPGVPLADDVRRIVGWSGSLRGYLDRLIPLLRVRTETDLGDIVRRRMGKKILDRLVTPVVAGVHSADPSVVDVHTVAPGLTQQMTVQGSLSGAVMALREQAPAGSQVQGIAGGVHRIVDALEADCRFYGVEFRTGTRVASVVPATAPDAAVAADARMPETAADADDGARWEIELVPTAEFDAEVDAEADAQAVTVSARALLVATGFRAGVQLLAEAGAGAPGSRAALPGVAEWPEPASVALATLVIDEARLDAHPRGSGVLVAPKTPGVTAKALTHSSAKWAWLAESLPAHRHALRLSYGRRDAAVAEVDQATALRDASTLLGVPLAASDVVGFDVVEWNDSLAFATVGHKARVRQAQAAVDQVPGLDVVGAWVSGTGLAATVAHARTTASALAAELRGDRRLPTD